MNTFNPKNKPKNQDSALLQKLLGSLELEVMELMWHADEATVHDAVETINRRRPIAYTSVMTVMGHLVDKGLLTRVMDGKRYVYRVAQDRDAFLRNISRERVRALVDDFGDVAIAQFLGEVENMDAATKERLRNLGQGEGSEGQPPK